MQSIDHVGLRIMLGYYDPKLRQQSTTTYDFRVGSLGEDCGQFLDRIISVAISSENGFSGII